MGQTEGDGGAFARLEKDPGEGTQFFLRTAQTGNLFMHVELDDLGAFPCSGVRHGERRGNSFIGCSEAEVRVLEGGVGDAVTECKERFDVACVVPAVAGIQPFGVATARPRRRRGSSSRRGYRRGERGRFGELP